jgi:hypothetical protein
VCPKSTHFQMLARMSLLSKSAQWLDIIKTVKRLDTPSKPWDVVDRQEECAQRLSIPSEVQHGLTMHTESRRLAVSMLPCQSLPHLLSVVAWKVVQLMLVTNRMSMMGPTLANTNPWVSISQLCFQSLTALLSQSRKR